MTNQTIPDITQVKKVHFIGIGGIGISAIARMMSLEGKQVTANDLGEFELVTALREFGVDTKIGTDPAFIPKDTELVIYSIAWNTLAPELLESVKKTGIPMLTYPQALGELTKNKYTIAVSGTHGKTTTTAMIAQIMLDAGLDPTVIVGSLLVGLKTNFIAGKSKYLLIEACEYQRSFLNYYPNILVINNIDNDHLDYYKDIADIQSAFKELAERVPEDGFVVTNKGDSAIAPVLENVDAEIMNYSLYTGLPMKLKVPGLHNRKNAAAAFAVASALGIPAEQAIASLEKFAGTWRRFEYKGVTATGAMVYDDYGHHPTEVKATLQGVRELYPRERVIVVFQPHLYSRTKQLLNDFADSFALADEVLLAPIYAAREEPDPTVSSEILRDKIAEKGIFAQAFGSVNALQAHIQKNHKKGDLIITMGAGDIYKVSEALVE